MMFFPNADGTLNEDSERYEGQYKDGDRHGRGYYVFEKGNRYFGEWSCDKIHGQGTKTWASGDTYTGSWKDGN